MLLWYVIMGMVGKRLPQHLALQCEFLEVSVCLPVFKPFSSAEQIRLIQRKYGRVLTGFYEKGLETGPFDPIQ